MKELPQISSYSKASLVYDPSALIGGGLTATAHCIPNYDLNQAFAKAQEQLQRQERRTTGLDFKKEKEPMAEKKTGKRVVQVFIVDADDSLPIENALLHKGEQQFTDLTDQELFFDIDIKTLLDKHNAVRVKTMNKKLSTGTEKLFLEPIKIRDLKMVVSTLAEF